MMREAVLVFVLCVLSLSVAQDCPLPTIAQLEAVLPPLLVIIDGNQVYSPNVTEGSVQYVCLAQGDMIDTYKAIALIATFTPNPGEPEQTMIFDIECSSGTWSGRTGSLDPPPPSVVGVPPRTDCYRCREGFGGDTRCRTCDSACNSGLMRCTGSGSGDCCLSFAASGQCDGSTDCTSSGPNYVATESNNFTCNCGLSCPGGYTVNSNCTDCDFTSICDRDTPCMNGGQCIQYSPPDNYTCNCTGTGYQGVNCTDLVANCSMETIASSDRGTFEWPETMPDSTVNISCPNGPSGASANRTCTNNNTWESPGIESCATTVISNQFRNISKVNVTAENVVSVSENLTDLVVSTTDAADQNTDNIRTVSAILDQTAILLSNPMIIMNLSSSQLSMTTENTVQILDSIEEWSPAVVEIESNNIINSFERIIDALINQDNFTNVTVVQNDIALKGESFQQAVFNGIEFTAASIGFFIFFFFVVLSSDSRNAWKLLLCPWTVRDGTASTVAKNKTSNIQVKSPQVKNAPESLVSINGKGNKGKDFAENLIFENKTILEDSGFSIDDEIMISEFGSIRFERHLSVRRTHYVEKIEIDFTDGDDDDGVDDVINSFDWVIAMAVLVFVLCVLSLSVAQDCPLPTIAEIEGSVQ
uniref:EGF-like domain-containing protein n=1 Tax=Amphimedon queenslandica TaxID=400682 RepID=A0A1X7UXI0_AMPQE